MSKIHNVPAPAMTLLADRIVLAMKRVDKIRNSHPFTPGDYLTAAKVLSESLAVLEELQVIWQAITGYTCTTHELAKYTS